MVGSRDLALVVAAISHHYLGIYLFTLVPIFHANDEDGEDADDGYDDDSDDVGHLSDHQHKLRPLLRSLRY